MYFDEGRSLNQPQYKEQGSCNQANLSRQMNEPSSRKIENRLSRTENQPSSNADPSETASMLDSANNRLQELMQLLYLLSRDPAVPSNARYHVTVAQGEIALLTRVMQNAASEQADDTVPPVEDRGLRPTNP